MLYRRLPKSYYSLFCNPIPNEVKDFMMKVDDQKILSSNFKYKILIQIHLDYNVY